MKIRLRHRPRKPFPNRFLRGLFAFTVRQHRSAKAMRCSSDNLDSFFQPQNNA
jgi:hypothetical protein